MKECHGDESWLHYFKTENKRPSVECRHKGSPELLKFNTATSFRDVDIVVHSKGIHTGVIISKHYFGTLQEMEGAYLKSSS